MSVGTASGNAIDGGRAGQAKLPLYEHFARIAGKFYRGSNGRIQGFGVVKFPLRNRVKWIVKE